MQRFTVKKEATRRFTDEEFKTMVSELLDEERGASDTLCTIAEKALRPMVRHWCSIDLDLRGRGMEDDIMQETFIRLLKTTVTHFLSKKDSNGESNIHPDKFQAWIITVAENITRDTASALRRKDYKTALLEDDGDWPNSDPPIDDDTLLYQREILSRAFNIVLGADAKIYKTLTWLAQSLFMLRLDITKIKSNDVIIAMFEEKTLFEMRDMLFDFAKKVDWIVFTPEQIEKIDKDLNAIIDGRPIGEAKYKECYMKKGGKASISDWVNRMNSKNESRIKL